MSAPNLKAILDVFDVDGDGQLNCIEMHQALGAAGCCPSVEEVQESVKAQGSDKGGLNVLQQLYEKAKKSYTLQELEPLFSVVDPGKKGTVDVSSLAYLLMNFNERLTRAEAHEFLQEMLKLPEEGTVPISDVASRVVKLQQ